mmetsp:Transcript_21894/g.50039  ORF Transcript_21894/g.50039 Transcript_21894/m.50039 type:complete len:243 (-) Transcript_21894:76-804(-)
MSVFDSAYAVAGTALARQAMQMGLPFVGFCRDEQCIKTFWDACPGCAGIVETCPLYEREVETWLEQSDRCAGWRGIQSHKVRAITAMIEMGKHVVFMDTDHKLLSKSVLEWVLAQGSKVDTVSLRRDWAHNNLNFGCFYARSTEGSLGVFRALRRGVERNWDQSHWNEIMQAEESAGRFSCLALIDGITGIEGGNPNSIRAEQVLRVPRCGLGARYDINTTRAPKCTSRSPLSFGSSSGGVS